MYTNWILDLSPKERINIEQSMHLSFWFLTNMEDFFLLEWVFALN